MFVSLSQGTILCESSERNGTMFINATSEHSKDQLAERVWNSMQRLGVHRLTRVRCESRGTTIVLRGTANSYYQKQLAQTIAAKVPGVHHVINQLQVIDAHPTL